MTGSDVEEPSPLSDITFVIHRAANGEIVTIYTFMVGGHEPHLSDAELAREALNRTARDFGIPRSEIDAVRVRADEIEKPVAYRVDVKRKALVPRG